MCVPAESKRGLEYKPRGGQFETMENHQRTEREKELSEKREKRDYLAGQRPADRLTVAGSIIQFVAFCDPVPAPSKLSVSVHAFVYIIAKSEKKS